MPRLTRRRAAKAADTPDEEVEAKEVGRDGPEAASAPNPEAAEGASPDSNAIRVTAEASAATENPGGVSGAEETEVPAAAAEDRRPDAEPDTLRSPPAPADAESEAEETDGDHAASREESYDPLQDDEPLPPVLRSKRQRPSVADAADENADAEESTAPDADVEAPAEPRIPRKSRRLAVAAEAEERHTDVATTATVEAATTAAKAAAADAPDAPPPPPSSSAPSVPLPGSADTSAPLVPGPGLSLQEAMEYLPTLPRRNPNIRDDARLFIGNMPSERTSQIELLQIFSKYGKIIEQPVLLKAYGFVQYEKAESVQLAMQYEQGRYIGHRRVDLSAAQTRRENAPGGRSASGGARGPASATAATSGRRPPPQPGAPYVRTLAMGPAARRMAHAMATTFHEMKIPCDVQDVVGGDLMRPLREAYERCIPYMLVVGDRDVHTGMCTLRTHERTGYERAGGKGLIPFPEAVSWILREEGIMFPVPPSAYTITGAFPGGSGGGMNGLSGPPSHLAAMATAPHPPPPPPVPYGYPNPLLQQPPPPTAGTAPYPYAHHHSAYMYGVPPPPPPPHAAHAYPGYGVPMAPGIHAGAPPPPPPPPPPGAHPAMRPAPPSTSSTAVSAAANPYAASQPASSSGGGADINQVKQLLATLQQFQQRNAAAGQPRGPGGI